MTIDCEMLSEKMPEVAHGTAGWTPEESAHLSTCFSCAAEWRLIQRAAHLGDGAAAGLDAGALSSSILAQVSKRGRRDRFTRNAWYTGLAAAAAVALVVYSGRGPKPGSIGPDSASSGVVDVSFHLPLSELETLNAEQLQAVLDGLDAPVGEVNPDPAPSFGDLDDTQLERVLRSLEG